MNETVKSAINGYLMIGVLLIDALVGLMLFGATVVFPAAFFLSFLALFIGIFIFPGFFIIQPNEARALVLFGKYKGTVKTDGFHWVIPFYKRERVSLRAHNLQTEKIKVNDKNGNPIVISAVIVWSVQDTAKALYAVDSAERFVYTQSEAALRHITGQYPYDNFDHEGANKDTITLRDGADIVSKDLQDELTQRLSQAGVQIIEARINHLAYAEEIASAMLQRQQASAIVAARREIVDGAVGMVEMALEQLSVKGVVELDNEKKAAMVSNLLVVLCGDQQASPVVNTGTLHQ